MPLLSSSLSPAFVRKIIGDGEQVDWPVASEDTSPKSEGES